jgi:hypothetical protein
MAKSSSGSMRTDTIACEPELLERYPGWDRAGENGIVALTAEDDLRYRAQDRMCLANTYDLCVAPMCTCHDHCPHGCWWHNE